MADSVGRCFSEPESAGSNHAKSMDVRSRSESALNMDEEKKVSSISLNSDGGSLRNNENLCSSIYQWDEYKKPTEIKCSGRYILSDTKKGKSIVFYNPDFIEENEASELMEHLLEVTNWQMKNVTIRGIEYPQPRLVAWYGPFPYSYSGTTLEPAEMPDCILEIKGKVEEYLKKKGVTVRLNSVLLNLYRNNKDSVSWHSDDETSMGIFPTIASVSLGDTRRFEMRRKIKYFEDESSYTGCSEYFVFLNNGSLLIMDGSMQKDWQHRVPKEHHAKTERINLTFRTVYKVESLLRSLSAPIKRSREKVTKVHMKTLDSDTKSDTVCQTHDVCSPLKHVIEASKSEAEDEICGDTQTNSCKQITLKTEYEDQCFKLSCRKRSTLLSNSNDAKNISNDSSSCNSATITDKKNKRLRTNTHSTATNSYLNNTVKEHFKIKSESTFSDKLNSSLEDRTFDSCELKDLLNYNVDSINCKLFLSYANALKNKVLENIDGFEVPEKDELEILCALTNGTLTEENWKIIIRRMHFIVDNALKLQQGSSKLS